MPGQQPARRAKSDKDEDKIGWSPSRLACWKMQNNQWFEVAINTIVVFNLGLIVYEVDYEAQCFPIYFDNFEACPFKINDIRWMGTCNLILLIVYSCEAMLRMYVLRGQFPFSGWNQLDVAICATGWFGLIFDGSVNLAFLRVFRLGRLARAFRFLFRIRELYLLLNGVISSLKAIFFGTLLLMVLLVVYSIILVEWVHPPNSQILYSTCSECTTAFKSVRWSTITLFKQLLAGDSWIISYPLIEREPGIVIIMMVIVVTVMLGMVNLILTVIVERATDAREKDIAENVRQKQRDQEANKQELLKLCEQMDDDGDRRLSMEELQWAYQDNADFRNMMVALDIRDTDLETIFKILDSDDTGHLEYEELCDGLVQLQDQDLRVMIALTRFSVLETRSLVERLDKRVHAVASDIAKNNEAQDAKLDSLIAHCGESQGAPARQTEPARQTVADFEQSAGFTEGSSNTSIGGATHVQAHFKSPPEIPSPASEEITPLGTPCPGGKESEFMHDAQQQVSILMCLQTEMRNLARAEAGVVHEAEKQISILLSHIALAASLTDGLRQRESAHEDSTVPGQSLILQDHLQMISSAVEEIQHGTRTQLVEAMQAIQDKMRVAGVVFDRHGELFHKINEIAPQSVLQTSNQNTLTIDDVKNPMAKTSMPI